jgi:hypothetical protein
VTAIPSALNVAKLSAIAGFILCFLNFYASTAFFLFGKTV